MPGSRSDEPDGDNSRENLKMEGGIMEERFESRVIKTFFIKEDAS
jgi:hypothetical protein